MLINSNMVCQERYDETFIVLLKKESRRYTFSKSIAEKTITAQSQMSSL